MSTIRRSAWSLAFSVAVASATITGCGTATSVESTADGAANPTASERQAPPAVPPASDDAVEKFLDVGPLQLDAIQVDEPAPTSLGEVTKYSPAVAQGQLIKIEAALPERFEIMPGQSDLPDGKDFSTAGVNITLRVDAAGGVGAEAKAGDTVTLFLTLWTGQVDDIESARSRIDPVIAAAPIGAHVVALYSPKTEARSDGAKRVARSNLFLASSPDRPAQAVDESRSRLAADLSLQDLTVSAISST